VTCYYLNVHFQGQRVNTCIYPFPKAVVYRRLDTARVAKQTTVFIQSKVHHQEYSSRRNAKNMLLSNRNKECSWLEAQSRRESNHDATRIWFKATMLLLDELSMQQ